MAEIVLVEGSKVICPFKSIENGRSVPLFYAVYTKGAQMGFEDVQSRKVKELDPDPTGKFTFPGLVVVTVELLHGFPRIKLKFKTVVWVPVVPVT
jgi:hypothetical protein